MSNRLANPNRARMLVVEDDPRSRKLLEGYLLGEGYQVRCAPDGPEALELVARQVPDVVLLDVMMPQMTGHEVCAALKAHPRTRSCQVMLVTALDSLPSKVEGLDTGADDYVTKPVRREEFLAKVRALLRARRLLVDLEDARAELAARNDELQLKKALAQSLVHDLKNPLAAILGNLELLEMRSGSDLLHLVQRSKRGADRMLQMILNLLDVERLEEGRLQPEQKRLNATTLVQGAVKDAEASAGQRDVTLVAEADGAVKALGDVALLRRVVDNLISNAVRHSPMGGEVRVAARMRAEGVEIAVVDSGPGVPAAYRENIFDKYRQIDARNSNETANRGLGLTFCRLAIEAHGGTIWVDDGPDGGACFHCVLAAAEPEGDEERTAEPVLAGHFEGGG
ncbi:MAG: response regulator [bacterium]|nr:response regulator [bacterium]